MIPAGSQLSENSHLGFRPKKWASHQGQSRVNSSTASGIEPRLRPNGGGSRCSGKERDAESGNDFFGARYYWSGTGRWHSVDLLIGKPDNPQTLNRYAYVLGDPINNIDPNGLLTIILAGLGTGFEGPDWGQPGTDFWNAVKDYFGEDPVVVGWCGCKTLSGEGMREGAEELDKAISGHSFKPGEKLNIVAHSHGGNVVKSYTNRSGAKNIDMLILLGTPHRSDFNINMEKVSNYYNVYSSFDFLQPLGGHFVTTVRPFVGFRRLPPHEDAMFNWPSWPRPRYELVWGFVRQREFEFATRSDGLANDIDASTVPGIDGYVNHFDLHGVPVWNWILTKLPPPPPR